MRLPPVASWGFPHPRHDLAGPSGQVRGDAGPGHGQDGPEAGGYLRLSEAYQEPAEEAKALGWPVTELVSHHLAMVTDPELVAGPLLDLVRQLQREET
jgi:hypothetical protein